MAKLVCKQCGGDDLHVLAWVSVDLHEFQSDGPLGSENQWCNTCEEHVAFCSDEEYDEKAKFEG